jgi:hypothetical protein
MASTTLYSDVNLLELNIYYGVSNIIIHNIYSAVGKWIDDLTITSFFGSLYRQQLL